MNIDATLLRQLAGDIASDLQDALALPPGEGERKFIDDWELADACALVGAVAPELVPSLALSLPAPTPPVRRRKPRSERQLRAYWRKQCAHMEPGPFLDVIQAFVNRRPDLLARLQTYVDEVWREERVYVDAHHDDPTEPAVFYACRAVAQSVRSITADLRLVAANARTQAIAILVGAVDAIQAFADRAGDDRPGCLAYHVRGLLWIAQGLAGWCSEEVLPLGERVVVLVREQPIL
jgi:hypothetical protein